MIFDRRSRRDTIFKTAVEEEERTNFLQFPVEAWLIVHVCTYLLSSVKK